MKDNLKQHDKIHKEVATYKISKENLKDCDICGANFSGSNGLKYHKTNVHNIRQDTKEYKCNICDSILKNELKLKGHKQNHNMTRETCEKCGREVKSTCLTRHVLYYHSSGTFKCEVCSKSFRKKELLKRHEKSVHRASMNLPCPICEKCFASDEKLKKHSKVHEEIKGITCEFCPSNSNSS